MALRGVPQHSLIVGGSTADRLLNCPASLAACRALPPSADAPSAYAEEGTFAHAVMDGLMRERASGDTDLAACAQALLGLNIYDRAVTREHLDGLILPALEQLAVLEGHFGAGRGPFAPEVLGVEQRVRFPGIPGAFGTVDLVLGDDEYLILVDWKFGQGVGVRTVYSDGEGTFVNPQLMYYATAALHTKPRWFRKRRIVVAIIQPRSVEPLTFTEITRHEIRNFVQDLHNSVLAAVDRDPPMRKGEHCRWAPCKVACPLWTGPLLDLAVLQPVARETAPPKHMVSNYALYLGFAKHLLDTCLQLKAEVDAQMHAYLENGGTIPGWKLKDKPTRRQWVDTDTVYAELTELGFSDDEIWREPELVTFQQADATAKRRGVKIPDELRVAPPSTGTTLATSDDPAPPVERTALVEKFAASLRMLQQAGK
jgi:hypothetical protein